MKFAFTNESTRVSDVDLKRICACVDRQLAKHVAPAWDRRAPSVKFYAKGKKLPEGAIRIHVVDSDGEPDAAGYHTEEQGTPYGIIEAAVVLDNGGTLLNGANSISCVCSHEAIEAFLNLHVSLWSDLPDGQSTPTEGCDAVQGNAYPWLDDAGAVSVSNFLLPAWFDPQATVRPFDWEDITKKPGTIAKDGYMVVRKSSGEREIFGKLPKHKAKMRRRRHQRLLLR